MKTRPLELKNPIVLVHGLGARSTYGPFNYFYGLPALLQDHKNRFLIATLTAWQSIEHRAQQLRTQIEKHFPDQPVNLIGHSMGGLDARYLAARPHFSERVASVTTLGTPHRGTLIGDMAVGLVPPTAFFAAEKLLKVFGSSHEPLKQVTRAFCIEEFPKLAPNHPQIAYFSATSAITRPLLKNALPFFWIPHGILEKAEGPNDGFVSVESAKWGDSICTYEGDHYAQVGQFLGYTRGLNYLRFYTEILTHLKMQGF